MADRTQLRIADRDDIAADDPFAELTRIMGFDPRVPVKPDNEPRFEDVADDDFTIDLEKELMGEFGEEPQAAAWPEAGNDASVSYDASASYAGADTAAQTHSAAEPDFNFDDISFDEPAFEQQAGAHSEAPVAAVQSAEADYPDFDLALEQELTVAETADADPFADFDAALTDELAGQAQPADDFAVFDDADFAFEEPAAVAPEPQAPATSEQVFDAGDDFERQLAAAVFDEQPAASADEPEWDVVPADGLHVPPQSYEQPHDDFAYAHAELPSVEAEVADEAPAPTLEDELNALLNRMSARPQPGYEPDFELERPLDVHVEHQTATAHVAQQTAAPVSARDDFDLDLDLGDFDSESAQNVQPQFEPQTPADPVDALKSFIPAAATVAAATQAHSWSRSTPFLRPQQQPAAATQPQASAQPDAQANAAAWQRHQPQPSSDAYQVTSDAYVPETPAAAPVAHEQPVPQAPARPPVAEIPELETIDIPERAVALADDLEIPDVPFEQDVAEPASYDDLEADFADLLSDMNIAETEAAQPAAQQADVFAVPAQKQAENAAAQAAQPSSSYDRTFDEDFDFDFDAAAQQSYQPAAAAAADDGFDYDPDYGETISEAEEKKPRNRLWLAGAIVAAVAVIGGIGAFALSFGGGDSGDAPVLVRADDAPIKVKPENPGGTVIPNQDNKVYDMVARGGNPAAPTQEKLFSDAEKPVDVAARAPEARVVGEGAPASAKSEERVAPATVDDVASEETPAVAPRKVRTMVVKPDGTLVPREEPAPAQQVAATEPQDPAPQAVSAPGAEQTGAVTPAAKPQQSANTPSAAPVAPQRPAEQPVNIVGEVKPGQVAALDPNAAAAGTWAVQIASQPSVEAAQSTYQDLARRYASVLQGRSVNIVKAEVAGKGTFYRVRVASQSRADAISLCESYKAAGGNCFVSK
ncbi:SPOR domain-containing protein [Aquamicrobium sp.]|uniref:SPOR domain-containing protein n=1 Tax=Aquamicrobium sp. TaxID=1872579 RepID=UPI0025857650|nr:SPOR domain-containing protein [Aquamicrobium sp.]MCK9552565.1 SPOR domain-containing protein [Aquamicrobium sp.]